MKCADCQVEMVEGVVGKEPPLHLRFVPKHKANVVSDYAGLVAHACPACGQVRLAVDPKRLRETTKT